jgi:general secretion pathway protein D
MNRSRSLWLFGAICVLAAVSLLLAPTLTTTYARAQDERPTRETTRVRDADKEAASWEEAPVTEKYAEPESTTEESSEDTSPDTSATAESTESTSATESAPAGETPPSSETPSEEGTAVMEIGEDDEVALNLNNVKIEKALEFLSKITDKVVTKHPEAKAQLTIVSAKKVTKEDAVRLIVEALQMQGISVIMRDSTIWVIPISKIPEMDIELLAPTDEAPPVGLIKKVIQVRFADVAELEKILKPALSKDAQLVVHPASKKIIVTDTLDRVRNLEKVIAQLDVLQVDERQAKIFPLENADAKDLEKLLQAVFSVPSKGSSQQGPPREGGPPRPSSAGVAPPVDVVAYPAANWLVVVAPEEQMETATSLINQLDQDIPEKLKLRVITIQYAEAGELDYQLRRLFDKRQMKKVEDTVEITADDRSNSLFILASEENFQIIKDLVEQVDTEEAVQTMTKTYPLDHADAEDIAEQLTNLYSGMQQSSYYSYWNPWSSRSSQGGETRFVAETRTNSIIAIADPDEFEKIDDLIKQLDVPLDPDQATPRIYRIKYISAVDLTDVLNQIFGMEDQKTGGYWDYYSSRYSQKTEVGRLYGKVHFIAEPSTNSIIVTTNNVENYPVIEAAIDQLDSITTEAANTFVVTLKHADAKEVAQQLNALFAREGAKAPKGEEQEDPWFTWYWGDQGKKEERPISNLIGQIRVVPVDRTNALIVTTAFQNFEAMKALIDKLDVETPKVLVAVRLIEISRTKSSRIGTRWTSTPSVFETEDFDNGLQSTFGATWAEVYSHGTLTAGIDVNVLVQFLLRNFHSRVLSDSTLAMNNNYESSIFAGSQIPFITGSVVSSEGSRSDTFEYKDAATVLTVTPRINELNKVVLKVQLESTQVAPEVILGGAVLDTRKFNTELAVESGQTMVMGGIMREQEGEQIRRVPILGHIPVLSLLFKKSDTTYETTELVAFITPTVLRTPEEDTEATRAATVNLEGVNDFSPLPPSDESGEQD